MEKAFAAAGDRAVETEGVAKDVGGAGGGLGVVPEALPDEGVAAAVGEESVEIAAPVRGKFFGKFVVGVAFEKELGGPGTEGFLEESAAGGREIGEGVGAGVEEAMGVTGCGTEEIDPRNRGGFAALLEVGDADQFVAQGEVVDVVGEGEEDGFPFCFLGGGEGRGGVVLVGEREGVGKGAVEGAVGDPFIVRDVFGEGESFAVE